MTTPTTWEEAAFLAAESISPPVAPVATSAVEWFTADLANLRRIFADQNSRWLASASDYARSMARRALFELSQGAVSFHERRAEILALIARKQHDYGHGNISAFGEKGVIVRLSDKVERYKNLLGRDLVQGLNESIEDTLVDIVGYAIILTMLENGTFELPLRADVKQEQITDVVRQVQRPDVFVVSVDDVRRIVREELKAYHFGRSGDKQPDMTPLLERTWARYAAVAFGGQ